MRSSMSWARFGRNSPQFKTFLAWIGVKPVSLENQCPAFLGSCTDGRGSGMQMTVCAEVWRTGVGCVQPVL